MPMMRSMDHDLRWHEDPRSRDTLDRPYSVPRQAAADVPCSPSLSQCREVWAEWTFANSGSQVRRARSIMHGDDFYRLTSYRELRPATEGIVVIAPPHESGPVAVERDSSENVRSCRNAPEKLSRTQHRKGPAGNVGGLFSPTLPAGRLLANTAILDVTARGSTMPSTFR
jgi:hypothetical protein